ncbi:MAG: hypothetical protein LQ352_007449 [Teloschistes flavicans]|nr:MAG: hypothetical protein LQ352_007449 [Teloschistes flavicans]
MASRPPSSRAPTGTAANPVRRNLFQGHLIRRPTGASSASVTTAGATSAPSSTAGSMPEIQHDSSSDIVVRDRNGEPLFQMPQVMLPTPTEEEQATAAEEGGEGMQSEKERLEERLLEAYKSRSFVAGDRTELLSAAHASLRRRVAALDQDNWMFEEQGGKPGG